MKNGNGKDKRLDPKPRKHPELWQAYLWWNELMQMRKRHTLRVSSIQRGKSNLNADFELMMLKRMGQDVIEITDEGDYADMLSARVTIDNSLLDIMVDPHTKKERTFSVESAMLEAAQNVGPIWDWLTGLRGLGAGGMSAQLLAMIDDIGKFDTVSKLWRFAGYAVIDGERETNKKGEKSHFNRQLKSLVYLIVTSFIKAQNSPYAEIYAEEKDRQKQLHPQPVCRECGGECKKSKNSDGYEIFRCMDCKGMANFTRAHLHARAMRKVGKIFLQHLWCKWREYDSLPVSQPYVQAILGHKHMV